MLSGEFLQKGRGLSGKELSGNGGNILMMSWRKNLITGLRSKLRISKLISNGSKLKCDNKCRFPFCEFDNIWGVRLSALQPSARATECPATECPGDRVPLATKCPWRPSDQCLFVLRRVPPSQTLFCFDFIKRGGYHRPG